jgi:tetratricopeptide (TPR) repeat protein
VRAYLALLIKTKNYGPAIQAADKLIAGDQTRWWAYEARGIAKRYLGQVDQAIADFDAALAQAKAMNNDEAAAQVVRTMAREVSAAEAIARAKQRAEKEPRWALMTAYLQQQDLNIGAAVETLDRVLKMDGLSMSDRETALRFGGSLYLQTGPNRPKPDAQKAYQCYMKLLELLPDDLTALNNIACLLAEVMDPPQLREALKYSQRAYEIMQKTGKTEPLILDTHEHIKELLRRKSPQSQPS